MKLKKSIQNTRLNFYRFNRHEITLGFCVYPSGISNRLWTGAGPWTTLLSQGTPGRSHSCLNPTLPSFSVSE